MATARTQTIVVAQPRRVARRSGGGGFRRRSRRSSFKGASPAKTKEKELTSTAALAGTAALGFGLIQRNVSLPGITGVPNSLTYGAGTAAIGVVAKSPTLVKLALGPLCAGLHNIGLKGLGGDTVAGEESEETAGEFDDVAAGTEVEEVTAGEFDDL